MPRWTAWVTLLLLLSLIISGCSEPFRDDQPNLNPQIPTGEQPAQQATQPTGGDENQTPGNVESSQTSPGDSTAQEVEAIQAELDEMIRLLEETDTDILIP